MAKDIVRPSSFDLQFVTMYVIKSNHRVAITDRHLQNAMHIAVTSDVVPHRKIIMKFVFYLYLQVAA